METTVASDAASATAGWLMTSLFCGFYCIFIVIGIVGFVLWIVMLIDILRRDESDFKDSNERLLWVLIILLGGWMGSLIYYIMIYRKLKKEGK